MNKWKNALAAFVVGGTLLAGSPVQAAEPAQNGMAAFREAYQAVSDDYRVFDEDLTLFGPAFHVDLDSRGQLAKNGSLLLSGNLKLMFTDQDSGKINNFEIPFYFDHNSKASTFYVQWGEEWNKLSLPGTDEISDALETTPTEIAENMALVKSVELVKETVSQRSMKLTLDGRKLAALVAKHCQETSKNLTPEEKATQQLQVERLTRAFESVDQEVTWVVDKKNWQTITAGVNLTGLMRAYAKVVLQEAADGKTVLSDGEREFWETLGYYAELHSYTTYPTDKAKVEIPAKVRKTAAELDLLKEIKEGAAAQKTE